MIIDDYLMIIDDYLMIIWWLWTVIDGYWGLFYLQYHDNCHYLKVAIFHDFPT